MEEGGWKDLNSIYKILLGFFYFIFDGKYNFKIGWKAKLIRKELK